MLRCIQQRYAGASDRSATFRPRPINCLKSWCPSSLSDLNDNPLISLKSEFLPPTERVRNINGLKIQDCRVRQAASPYNIFYISY
jgi:hypothetical protein